tara:strand:- start:192 stop:788 length:597 start_codon:yes stop_codon:yes gene_type:complete
MSGIITDNLGRSSGLVKSAGGGGSLVKLAETNISSGVATVSFDGYFTSDYDIYKIYVQNLRPVGSSNYQPCLRFRRSDADVTTSDYFGAAGHAYSGGNNHNGDLGADNFNIVKDSSVIGNSDHGFSAEITIYNPLQTTRFHMMTGVSGYMYSTDRWYAGHFSGSLEDNTDAISGFTFLNDGGENFDDGNIYFFGIKTS